jgi:4-amino-4-deoxy-L-arabinose transferase-like glycosyltransferase
VRHAGRIWQSVALAGVLALAACLSLYQIDQQGYGNTYYAAAVKSMLTNWHAFFFASFDAAGFVTVDKPPLGLWIQAAFTRVFGFHGVVLLLPQALAAVASVALVYHVVRRAFGGGAGLLAAAAMAVTPIAVAVSRTNNLDSLLVFTLLLAAWAVVRAVESGRLRWLLLGAVLVGLGFNIKMLQAYLVVPAFGLLYLLAAPVGLRKRLGGLALAGVVLLAVSLSWAAVVDLTPASARPYVGSSDSNSALDLALGYNGLQRLLGRQGGGPARGAAPANANPAAAPVIGTDDAPVGQPPAPMDGMGVQAGSADDRPRADGGGPGGGGPGGLGENGAKGWLRLFNQQLGGQIAWLLPLALIGVVVAWTGRPNLRRDRQQQAIVLWGTWLLTGAVFFSVAGFYHRYYLIMLAPPIAALAAAAATALWRRYRAGGWQGFLLPAAILLTAVVQWHILGDYPVWRDRLAPVLIGGSALLVAALIVARFSGRPRPWLRPAPVAAIGMLVLLAAPATWSALTVRDGSNTTLPAAGPSAQGGFGGPGGTVPPSDDGGPTGAGGDGADDALLAYLDANRGDAEFLVATQSSMQAAPIILATGEPVMAMGGFSGGDPILTADDLARLVRDGTVRFFLVGGRGPGGGAPFARDDAGQQARSSDAPIDGAQADGRTDGAGNPMPVGQATGAPAFAGPTGGAGSGMAWVTQYCAAVPSEAIGGTTTQLYDCAAVQG